MDYNELAQLERAATPGPVEVTDKFWLTYLRTDSDGVERRYGVAGAFTLAEDAVLYAAARNALPGLLAERAQLRAALGALAAAYLAEERRANEERERCARIATEHAGPFGGVGRLALADQIAAAIRGEEPRDG